MRRVNHDQHCFSRAWDPSQHRKHRSTMRCDRGSTAHRWRNGLPTRWPCRSKGGVGLLARGKAFSALRSWGSLFRIDQLQIHLPDDESRQGLPWLGISTEWLPGIWKGNQGLTWITPQIELGEMFEDPDAQPQNSQPQSGGFRGDRPLRSLASNWWASMRSTVNLT